MQPFRMSKLLRGELIGGAIDLPDILNNFRWICNIPTKPPKVEVSTTLDNEIGGFLFLRL